ncbi:gamma-crystallin-3-like [Ambystoma mexicanum]|uniref:gamma-crystallin-3-like n=1 Tax=Ambystoma mexicanum TaxID=8296 RepID=UPI0037E7A72C
MVLKIKSDHTLSSLWPSVKFAARALGLPPRFLPSLSCGAFVLRQYNRSPSTKIGGRSYDCSSDCADLNPYFSRCNSLRVHNGCWILYEHPNYKGHQYYLRKGEYPDYQTWMGYNDSIGSPRMIPELRGCFRIRLYERGDFGGQTMDFTDDCPNVYDRFPFNGIHSSNVQDGNWIFYEEPNYKGRQYYLRPGKYKGYSDWGASSPRIGSIRRVDDI